MKRGVNRKVFSGVVIVVFLSLILVSLVLPWFGNLFEKQVSLSPVPFLVTNIKPTDYKSNSSIDLLKKEDRYYLDRTYTIISDVPSYLNDSKKILTKIKSISQTNFTINNDARVYLAWDMREKIPSGWKNSTLADLRVSDSDASKNLVGKAGSLKLIYKDFGKGNVVVPARTNTAYSNYIVFVKNISFSAPVSSSGVANPGFETALHPTTDWSFSSNKNVSRSSLEKQDGSYSLNISGRGYSLNHPTLLKNAAGKNFTLTVWAKNNSAVKVTNKVGVQSSKTNIGLVSGSAINFAGLSNSWKKFSSTFTLPSDVGIDYHVLLATEPGSSGTIWFDNISLVEVTGPVVPPTTKDGSCIWPPVGGVKMAENKSLMNSPSGIEKGILCYYGVWQVTSVRDSSNISAYKQSTANPKGYVVRNEGAKVGNWTVKNGVWIQQGVTPTTICTENDGGKIFSVKGTTLNSSGISQTDKCVSNITKINESWCEGNAVKSEVFSCGAGKVCSDGKCEADIKPVTLTNAIVEQNICEGYIDVKCVMNDTFDDINKQRAKFVSNLSIDSSQSVFYIGNLTSAPTTYVYKLFVSKTLSGKYSIGCSHVRLFPNGESEIKTIKSDYQINVCPGPDTTHCPLPVLKSGGNYETEFYDIGDVENVDGGPAYCDVGGKWVAQKEGNDNCDEDYECLSDKCDSDGECRGNSSAPTTCYVTGVGRISVGEKYGSKYCSSDGVLANLQSDGTDCAYAYKCLSGICTSGSCGTAVTSECTFEGDCSYNEECLNGNCVAISESECTSNSDCGTGEECSSSGNCVAVTPSGCTVNSDCTDGEVCNTDGQCVKSSSALFWTIFFILLILSIIVLVAIWFVYKNKKIGSEPGRKINVPPKSSPPSFSSRRVYSIFPREFKDKEKSGTYY